jgi:small subunit ribosomal protein S4
MSNRTKFKMQRALGLELAGLGKPGALATRSYPPGQHGQSKNKKLSEFVSQLREKQKLLFHYGLREEQLRCFVRDARTLQQSNWIESLVGCSNAGSTTSSSGSALPAASPPPVSSSTMDMSW